MARQPENAVNAAEAAMNAGEHAVSEATKAGERFADDTIKMGGKFADEATKLGERAVAETADRIEKASTAYGSAMEAALRAVQGYNTKLIDIFRTNTDSNIRLAQTLMQTRSPGEFIEAMGKSVRERVDLIADQTRELAALSQEATRRAIEAVAPGAKSARP
jgi:hypothetical protein